MEATPINDDIKEVVQQPEEVKSDHKEEEPPSSIKTEILELKEMQAQIQKQLEIMNDQILKKFSKPDEADA